MDQALNSQKTPHTSPLRASYGMSFVSILMKNDRVIKGFYCIQFEIDKCSHNYFRSIIFSTFDPFYTTTVATEYPNEFVYAVSNQPEHGQSVW